MRKIPTIYTATNIIESRQTNLDSVPSTSLAQSKFLLLVVVKSYARHGGLLSSWASKRFCYLPISCKLNITALLGLYDGSVKVLITEAQA